MVVFTRSRFFTKNHIWFEDVKDLDIIQGKMKKCDEIVIHGNSQTISV